MQQNVVLVIHLILALALIAIVLLQRSEGGGLGMGGGGGAGRGIMSARGAATALNKLTWYLAAGFIMTSIALTIISAENSAGQSVLDRVVDQSAPAEAPATTENGLSGNLLPPSDATDAPLVPSGN